ncbi:MAG: nuclear transport factor 2 family protein [Deltaproteobacteria bacterium]|nr:nuclear transport factor 2 family protein [Deltaproteobacteria bacterium]
MTRTPHRAPIAAGLLAALSACSAVPAPSAARDPDEPVSVEFESIEVQVESFMDTEDVLLTQGNFEGFGALMTPDVFWIGPGDAYAVAGRPAAIDAARALFGAPDGAASLCSFCTPAQSVGATADRRAAWVAEEMPGTHLLPDGSTLETAYRVTSFVVRDRDRWFVAAQHWSVGLAADDAPAGAGSPAPIADDVEAGAETLVAALDEALASPEALEARISTRPDTFLFGLGLDDRAEGGDAARQYVRAKVAGEAVRFSRTGGVRAALAPGGSAGFVACNLDTSVIVDRARTTRTSRALFVWLLENEAWRIVQLHISHGDRD